MYTGYLYTKYSTPTTSIILFISYDGHNVPVSYSFTIGVIKGKKGNGDTYISCLFISRIHIPWIK